MASQRSPIYSFGPFLFDPGEQRLWNEGAPVAVTPKVLETLRVLVEQPGKLVDKEELIRNIWPDTFVQDVTVARHISDLRRALGEPARGGRYIQTVPTRGYRFIAAVQRTDDQAERLELSAAEFADPKSTIEPPAVETRRWSPSRPVWLAISVVAALLIAAATVIWRGNPPQQALAVRSLAVLPFNTDGASESERIFAEGLADSVITRLSRLGGLNIRPIDAVRELGGLRDPRELGRQLRVDAVLTGAIARDGGSLVVAAQLIDVDNGRLLWSRRFADANANLLVMEQAIVVQLASAVLPTISRQAQSRLERRYTENAEANIAYLRGRYFWGRRTKDGLERAVASLEQAVHLDPSFGLAAAALADAYVLLSGHRSETQMIARARQWALTALEQEPALGEAHATLGLIAMNYDWDWSGAEREFQTAIRLSPQYATVHHWYGEYLAYQGRFDEAVAEMRRAAELDPLSLIIGSDTGKVLFMARRYDEAIAALRHTLDLEPDYPLARAFLAYSLSAVGDHAEAISALQLPGQEDDVLFLVTAASVYERAGRHQDAKAHVQRLIALSEHSYVTPYLLAYAHVAVGDFDAAFAAFDRMCAVRGNGAIAVRSNPLSDPVRQDPRFARLLDRLGMTPS